MRTALPTATALALLLATGAPAQSKKYSGPKPPKADLPYLLHANNLIPLETGTATEESRKDDTANVIKGAASPARTPLAEPIFLLESKQLLPEKLELYRLSVSKSGDREVVFPKNPKKLKEEHKPIRLSLARIDTNLYRLEATEALDNGAYCLTPSGSQEVFCFDVY